MPVLGQNVRFERRGVMYSGIVTAIIDKKWILVGLLAVRISEIL